jgi:hypothetical protein
MIRVIKRVSKRRRRVEGRPFDILASGFFKRDKTRAKKKRRSVSNKNGR